MQASGLRVVAAAIAATSAAASFPITDATLGPVYQGTGAISGGGSTSRLFYLYPDQQREEILDWLFKPDFGMALHTLKVEIGGGGLSTEGSEASHQRTATEAPNYHRGWEWRLMVDAKQRNPDIQLVGLPWTWPGWIGDAGHRNPWQNVTAAAVYVVNWLKGARDVYNLTINVIGIWNERAYSPQYVKALRAMMDAEGFTATAILCDDGKYLCVPDMLKDPALAAAVTYVGGHDPAPPQAAQTGKPLIFSEDFHSTGGDSGAGVWANQLNRRYLQYNMTGGWAWNTLDSFYTGLSFDNTGLMRANNPWTGHYDVLGTVWATAHTTQFAQPLSWFFLPIGSGSGFLNVGGSYVTRVNPATNDFSLVVEKFSNDGDHQCAFEAAQFCLGGNLATVWTGKPLQVWISNFTLQTGETSSYFNKQAPIATDGNGCFTLGIQPDSLITVTSLTSGGKGNTPTPPPAAPFPTTWQDNFNACPANQEAPYFTDISGSFECVNASDSSRGVVMQQVTGAQPIAWEHDYAPSSLLGDMNWADVNVTVDVMMSSQGHTGLVGTRVSLYNQSNYAALMAELQVPGLWFQLTAGSGSWALVASMQNASIGLSFATGQLPFTIAAGQWYTVTAVTAGNSLSVWVSGQQVVSAYDVSRYAYTGWVGIGCAQYGHDTQFDNFSVVAQAPAMPVEGTVGALAAARWQ